MRQTRPDELIKQLSDARERTCALIDHLSDEQLMGPRLPIVNPLRWEIGHTAYFYEYWILRYHYQEPPLICGVDELFDSIHIAHETRWDLKLPSLDDTINYMKHVKERVVHHLSNGQQDDKRDYLTQYAIFHEDMHCEAFTYTRQTLKYPVPKIVDSDNIMDISESIKGDAEIPEGRFLLGALRDMGEFVFDNEKWSHSQYIIPFRISRTAVSNKEYAEFVNSGGYQCREYWCESGWSWLSQKKIKHPIYWRFNQDANCWQIRLFDQWLVLNPEAAVMNVNWYEASAYCRWANRRLPTELEWEVAAAGVPASDGLSILREKRLYPWGNFEPSKELANFNGETLGAIDVNAKVAGDSAFGCRQMLGNVWEWTSSVFSPYPEFTPDMYQDYSLPLFGKTRVLRGGCWATRARLMRNTWRNYYGPERNDIFAGFRTCAID